MLAQVLRHTGRFERIDVPYWKTAPHIDDESILRAANVAGVSDFLRTHPHGFDLQVGERGMALSGGQRQSVAIARARRDLPIPAGPVRRTPRQPRS